MTPQELRSVLALSIPKETGCQNDHRARGSDCLPHPGERESHLGSSQYPRRAVEARIEDFRANRLAIPCAVASPRRGCSTMANVSEEPPRTDYRMDFFIMITANFRILHRLFLIQHDRPEIIHLNVTAHPTGEWVVQQLREAFPENTDKRYLIFDRDAKSNYRSPWQNRVAERWVRSFWNDLLDYVIVLQETHFRRLARVLLSRRSHSRWIRQRHPTRETAIDQESR
jgi:putative transposase